MTPTQRQVVTALSVLAAALIFVGIVSGTVLRHIVQIVPLMVALTLVVRRSAWGAYAAMPLFLCWLLIAILIWLFLLGLSRIANGHYTVAEVIATFVMAGAAIVGVVKSVALGRSSTWAARILAFAGFGLFQFVAMWVSFLQPIANR